MADWQARAKQARESCLQDVINRGVQYGSAAAEALLKVHCECLDEALIETMAILEDQLRIDRSSVTRETLTAARTAMAGYLNREKQALAHLAERIDPPLSRLEQSHYARLFLMEKRLADLFARFRVDPPHRPELVAPAIPPAEGKEDHAMADANPDKKSVFVVHGRNRVSHDAMFAFLRALGLKPKDFSSARLEISRGAPPISDVLKWAFDNAWCVLVLITGDDEGRLQEEFWKPDEDSREKAYFPQPRLNVVFEAGMALSHDEGRTVLVRLGESRSFSDIVGRYVHPFDGSPESRNALKGVLASIGCHIEEGPDWLSAGDFKGAAASSIDNGKRPVANGGKGISSTPQDPSTAASSQPGVPSSFTLTEAVRKLLIAAADKGQILVFNPANAAGYVIKVGGEVLSGSDDPLLGEEFYEAIGFLLFNHLARQEGENVVQLNAKGFKLARSLKT